MDQEAQNLDSRFACCVINCFSFSSVCSPECVCGQNELDCKPEAQHSLACSDAHLWQPLGKFDAIMFTLPGVQILAASADMLVMHFLDRFLMHFLIYKRVPFKRVSTDWIEKR